MLGYNKNSCSINAFDLEREGGGLGGFENANNFHLIMPLYMLIAKKGRPSENKHINLRLIGSLII